MADEAHLDSTPNHLTPDNDQPVVSPKKPFFRPRNIIFIFIILLAIGLVILVLTSHKTSKKPTSSTSTTTFTGNFTGKNRFGLTLGDHVWPKKVDDKEWEATIDGIAATGTTWIRTQFPWSSVEASKGKFDWTVANYAADYIAKDHLKLDLLLNYTQQPSWTGADTSMYGCDNAPDGVNAQTPPPFNFQDYKDLAAAAANAMFSHSAIAAIELGNEPDNANIKKQEPNACLYTALDKMSYAAIKSTETQLGNANRYVILNAGLAGGGSPKSIAPKDFLNRMYADNGGTSDGLFDVFSYHTISHPNTPNQDLMGLNSSHTECKQVAGMPGPPKGWCNLWLVRQVMIDHHDQAKPTWITAFGIPTIPVNRCPDPKAAYCWKDGTNIDQARWQDILESLSPPTSGFMPDSLDCGTTSSPAATKYPGCSKISQYLGSGSTNNQVDGIDQAYSIINQADYNWVGPLFYFSYNDAHSPECSSESLTCPPPNGVTSFSSGKLTDGDFAGLVDINGNPKPALTEFEKLIKAAQ